MKTVILTRIARYFFILLFFSYSLMAAPDSADWCIFVDDHNQVWSYTMNDDKNPACVAIDLKAIQNTQCLSRFAETGESVFGSLQTFNFLLLMQGNMYCVFPSTRRKRVRRNQ
jgi:hypothetical protein